MGGRVGTNLYFSENTVADSLGNYTTQVVETVAATSYFPIKVGYFSDNTAYTLATKSSGGAGTITLFRRTGAVWSKLIDLSSYLPGVNLYNPVAFENKATKNLYVFWSEYSTVPSSHIDVKALVINLDNQSATLPSLLLSIDSPIFSNEVNISADFKSVSNEGVVGIHANGLGLAYLGKISDVTFSSMEEFRPDLSWSSVGFKVGVLGCDKVMFAAKASGQMRFEELAPNQYDGINGN
jgi:hypothetical protein